MKGVKLDIGHWAWGIGHWALARRLRDKENWGQGERFVASPLVSLFPIPHSPFPIPHSPFPSPQSPIPIPHSPIIDTLLSDGYYQPTG
ncbi:hypothetical protein [Nostoc sp. UHCC 0251]|uniref:hypothetical protein n=1 Tax=Nostoc sp. UHCC 0251 TaxID=3110240 RepID=UPI002B201012|nr:hypothetical protein [Nostoc sp. UHCC 0251]MEA5621673.1 hypothetical protein [Nostoc sp. UHCC 0251]